MYLSHASRAVSQEVLVAAAQADSHAGVGALCWIVYDTIINLSDEVQYIWSGPNTWMKWMYLFIRYFPMLAEASLLTITTSDSTGLRFTSDGCRNWITYQAAVVEATTLAVEIILIVRVYALYNRNHTVLLLLALLFFAENGVMIYALIMSIPRMKFNPECLISGAPKIFMAFWITSLTFETILFIMMLAKLASHIKRSWKERDIIYVFVRDGTWAFAMIFVTMCLNTLMYQLVKNPLAGICFFWDLSVMSFCGSRMLLNLRRLAPAGASSRARLRSGSVGFFTTDFDWEYEGPSDPSGTGWSGSGQSLRRKEPGVRDGSALSSYGNAKDGYSSPGSSTSPFSAPILEAVELDALPARV